MDTFTAAIQALGGQNKLAEQVGVTPQAVYLWVRNGRVPAERALTVAKVLGLQPHELRPDLYPPPDQSAPAESSDAA